MSYTLKYPDYVSISYLSKILNISPVRIETDFKTNKINKFLIDNMNKEANKSSRNRIIRVIDRLNEYARNNINKGPYDIIARYNKCIVSLTNDRQTYLNNNINSDCIFELWLSEYNFNIKNFKLVIPADEAIKYDKYISSCQYESNNNINAVILSKDEYMQRAAKYIYDLRSKGENDTVVAALLSNNFPQLKGHDCMKLIDQERVSKWENSNAQQGRPKQWFYELRKKGSEILNEREGHLTPS